jgi:hypothetical protein
MFRWLLVQHPAFLTESCQHAVSTTADRSGRPSGIYVIRQLLSLQPAARLSRAQTKRTLMPQENLAGVPLIGLVLSSEARQTSGLQ